MSDADIASSLQRVSAGGFSSAVSSAAAHRSRGLLLTRAMTSRPSADDRAAAVPTAPSQPRTPRCRGCGSLCPGQPLPAPHHAHPKNLRPYIQSKGSLSGYKATVLSLQASVKTNKGLFHVLGGHNKLFTLTKQERWRSRRAARWPSPGPVPTGRCPGARGRKPSGWARKDWAPRAPSSSAPSSPFGFPV